MNNQVEMEFASDDSLAGFRLKRIEVYNWGTFHNKVWTLTPEGQNVLVTGDIGSGKSTLVDAITTLVVPANRITYNKAAGAGTKERSLRSYVQGYYKSERSNGGYGARPVALRDMNNYSVVLGVFCNSGYMQTVSIAQIFWQKEALGQPARFYVIADDELTITEDFSDFGNTIRNLKKRLKLNPKIKGIFDSFPPYATAFRRRFGIENDQALDLFHQTVSMKSVGNLTDFVRSHMLEAFDIEPRINALINHFDDLTRAHDAVLKAKKQIEHLTPIVKNLNRHKEVYEKREHWRYCREGLSDYFTKLKTELLKTKIQDLEERCTRYQARIEKLTKQKTEQLAERDNLRQAISENGGDRLERIKADIQSKESQKQNCLNKSKEYQEYAEKLDFFPADNLETFLENKKCIREQLETFEQTENRMQNDRTEVEVHLRTKRDQHTLLCEEIESLKQRKSNINARQITVRANMCKALSIPEEELPFVGELLQVREEDALWEGAIERILHNFGLSLLVPERYYKQVASWVDRTNLRGRIVYYRVTQKSSRENISLHPVSLVRKISIKPESEFYSWLEFELSKRFDYACCDTLDQFRREKQAVTRMGQIKGAGNRHEKDDRHRINDRSRYILGWSNKAKIAALQIQRKEKEKEIQNIATEIREIQNKTKILSEKKSLLIRLDSFSKYDELDWKPLAQQIAVLKEDQRKLEEASDILKTLSLQLSQLEEVIKKTEKKLDDEKKSHAKYEEKLSRAKELLKQCFDLLSSTSLEQLEKLGEYIEPIRQEVSGDKKLDVESAHLREQEVRSKLQQKIDNEDTRLKNLEERIIKNMQDYRHTYVAETSEVDAAIDSGPEFRKMLDELKADGLPKFEKKFKTLLNENTIREIANFQSQLNRERQDIKERIDLINQSLTDIEYNQGRYIILEAQANTEKDIRDFQQSLRACTEGSLTGSDEEQYAENKFLQVKAIIDKFRGREGSTDSDKRWTSMVTDVRNWYVFAASERWQEDHTEHEHYTDSGGKSGGQKEKLAYTVLAASLAYQFGLEWGEVRSRSFRFVVIDEAFGRGSDESARFGLELFKKLNLQLLIVTPLQKIHIIEPYVSSVGFVHSPDGKEAQLRNLTIEEYHAEKDMRKE